MCSSDLASELHPLPCHPVKIWRSVFLGAERADVSIAHVVHKNEDNVRPEFICGGDSQRSQQKGEKKSDHKEEVVRIVIMPARVRRAMENERERLT